MRNILLFLLCLSFSLANGQNEFKVSRGFKIDRSAPIYNIHVDDKGLKWVADELGLVLLQSANFATPIDLESDIWSLLTVPNGNYELKIPKEQLKKHLGDDLSIISTAHYDEANQELWLGTESNGLYHFKIGSNLSLLNNLTTSNSKLRSNTIQTMEGAGPGRVLIGTDDGLLEIQKDKSKLYGKGFSIEAIAIISGDIWVVSDGEVLQMNKGDFYYFETDDRMVEGQVKDIAFDSRERLWIASEIVIRYDFLKEDYEVYGPIQEFTSQNVNCIAVDFDDALWVGTQDKGLYFIGKASTLLAEVVITTPLDCKPDSKNAALQVRASGGNPPYDYKWTGGRAGEAIQNIGAGTYVVTVTDKDNNSTEVETIIEETQFTVDVQQEQAASLGGNADGRAKLTITPDSRAFKIKWDNGETTRVAEKLNTGEHSVTITGSKGCNTIARVQIDEELAPLQVEISGLNGIDCPGNETASLKAAAKGGQAPYTFQWSGGTANGDQTDNLGAGTHSVSVSDATGTTAIASISIEEPEALNATATARSAASTNNSDGKAKVSVTGGKSPYSYQWDSGETADVASQLAAGTHTVSITDASGCTTTASVEITENILSLSVELEETQKVDCSGGSSAALQALVSGGKSPFQYQWSTDKGAEEKASGLSAGAYQISITDATGNQATSSININQPDPITATTNVRSAASTNNSDGKARVNSKGGTGKYTYQWDSGETTQIAEKLNAGTHSVTVTDANGCNTTATVEITENILALNVSIEEVAKIKCVGESTASLKVVANGGKPPFQYQWSTPNGSGETASNLAVGAYEVSITDAAGTTATAQASISEPKALELQARQTVPASTNNSDGEAEALAKGGTGAYSYKWDTGASTAKATGLSPGNHSLTLTDQNGCQATASINITENILPLVISLKQTADIKCNGEETAAVEVDIQGGKSPFQYQWSSADISGKSASNLGIGEYSVSVIDANGGNQSAFIKISEPSAIVVDLGKPSRASSEDSADGRVKLSVDGGTGEYSISWDNEETGLKAQKLAIGDHSVTITDANGCQDVQSFVIKKKLLPALTAGRLSAGQTLQVSQIYFDADSTTMNPGSHPVVNEIADFLAENPTIVIEVGGHTNNIPPHEFCDRLSTGRAKSVAEYIVQRGIESNRVVYKGYGKRKPRFSNKTDDGRRRNQRVEVKILRLN